MSWAPRAVVIVHGIGAQQRGATVNSLVSGLADHAGVEVTPYLIQETVPFGEDIPPDVIRIERDGVEADLYEVYWAPFASGKTTARSVAAWLLRATFIPGDNLKWPSRKTWWDLTVMAGALAAASVVLLLALTSLGNLSAQVACRTDPKVVCQVPPDQRELTGDDVTGEYFGQLTASLGAIKNSLSFVDRPLRDVTPAHAGEVLTGISIRTWALLAMIAYVTAQCLFRAQQLLRSLAMGLKRARRDYRVVPQALVLGAQFVGLLVLMQAIPPVLVAFVWVLVGTGFLARVSAKFLSESVGDVQVYTERDENSTHYAAREAVLKQAEKVFAAIEARGYRHVVVLGHSLGSVVAFTALDRLVRRNPALASSVEAFVTFGTALEKVRYFFERKRDADRMAAEQLVRTAEMITAGRAWINLWYANDLVANSITTFQGPGSSPRSYRWGRCPSLEDLLEESRRELVVNISFGWPWLPTPLWTHSRYLVDPVVLRILGDVALPPVQGTARSSISQA